MSTPQSTIYVCSGVRLDNRYEHTIYFEDAQAQHEYFMRKVKKVFSAYSYLRKSWPLQVQATMEEARTWSYLFFQNGTGRKYYYYFITQVEYKNDNTVELTLELDVIQTYLFDIKGGLLPSFVERMHPSADEPGNYTADENLDLGCFVDSEANDQSSLEDLAILVLATINPNYTDTEKPVQALAGNYNGVFSGLKLWAVDGAKWAQLGNKLDDLAEAGFQEGIVSMWMYPKSLIILGGENTWEDDVLFKVVDSFPENGIAVGFPGKRPTTLDGYEPRNKKLLTYPFQFLYCSNNAGGSAVYRYERFENPDLPQFTLYGSLSPEGAVMAVPRGYNGLDKNFDQAITLGGYPTCAWDTDIYKMWLAQNQNQQKWQATDAVIKASAGTVAGVASALTGNIGGAIGGVAMAYSGASTLAGMLAQRRDMEIQPPQAKGNFSTSLNITAGKQTFTFYKRSINRETAQMIDSYFDIYGYKIGKILTPSLKNRSSWTFLKTVGCKINADMCTEDLVKIENLFDRGITFWVDGDQIGNYRQDNT